MGDRIRNIRSERLSDYWGNLDKYSLEYRRTDDQWENQIREVYDHGNGAAILLYNQKKKTVILIRQLRFPSYINGHPTGMLLEVPAGLLDDMDPLTCILNEAKEETGYAIKEARQVMEVFVSPGSLTEKDHLFVAEYSDEMKVSDGGGKASEQEDIEVLEVPFDQAHEMIGTGEIQDAKTVILLQWARIEGIFNLPE